MSEGLFINRALPTFCWPPICKLLVVNKLSLSTTVQLSWLDMPLKVPQNTLKHPLENGENHVHKNCATIYCHCFKKTEWSLKNKYRKVFATFMVLLFAFDSVHSLVTFPPIVCHISVLFLNTCHWSRVSLAGWTSSVVCVLVNYSRS